MSGTRTTCPYCGVGCGLLVSRDAVSRDATVRGDPEHPANLGRLCSKGAALGETLGHAGRLGTPRIAGARADWDSALDLVAGRFTDALREHGPDSVAFYVSGQILTEDYYVANKLMKGFFGSANIDTNSRLCMASSVAGHKRAFGSDTVPGTYEDFETADLVVLVGSNLAWCHPVLYQRLMAARAARPQMKIVVIDPRRTATCDGADLHLAIRADTDIALFNGLLAEIMRRGAQDDAYVDAHVAGLEPAIRAARADKGADTGLTADEIGRFHDLWIATPRVVTLYSQGVNQSACGSDKVNAILNCHLVTGRIGRPGTGPFSVTGQPNAMGGREVGGLANMLACHLDIENPEHRALVREHWQSPTICTRPGLRAVDLFGACARGDIKALWIIATNPAVSMPDADQVSRAIAGVPFCVVSDVTETDTTALADVLLPAAAWGEKTGTVTNSERRISLQRAFAPAPGSARPDWQIICDVARRMGWGDAFSYDGPAAIFREYAALSGRAAALGRDFDISGLAGISDQAYDALTPQRWPVPSGAPGRTRFFGAGGFFHRDGRARMQAVRTPPTPPAPASASGAAQGATWRLNTGRIRDQWHTMTRSGTSPRLSAHSPEPVCELHPADGERIGLREGDLVVITGADNADTASTAGRAILRVAINPGIARASIFVPMHWSARNAAAGRINVLTRGRCDPVSGQPALKGGRVSLRRFAPHWHGFAASDALMRPRHAYGAVARTATGWRCDLAGCAPATDWQEEARAVLNLSGGCASLLHDAARGLVRVAVHDGALLRGLFFASRAPLAVSRGHIIAQIGREQPAFGALAGVARGDRDDPGATVCACLNIGRNTIIRAIRDGAQDLNTLGRRTRAGGNCGSCRPELQSLIDNFDMPAAAE